MHVAPKSETSITMETTFRNFAQANAGRVRRAALFIFRACMVTRLSCLLSASQTNCWMWVIFIFEAIWIYQSLAIDLPRKPGETTKRHHLAGNSGLPSVDILLPCCGEPLNIILDTIRAACVIDYPQSAFRVLVLDDGNSIELRQAVKKLHDTWPNLFYYSRGAKSNRKVFAKAGNLNYALFNIQGAMSKPPDFIVVFDADFLAAPNFLRATLPHLLKDDSVGLVGTPQDYYNLPPGDPLFQDMGFLWEIKAPRLNELGSSLATGSGFVIRRELAVQVGGFPTINEMEDITLSIILPAYGKRVVVLEEMLQLGRVPASLEGCVRQTRRWTTGFTKMMTTPWASSRDSVPQASWFPMAKVGFLWLWRPLYQGVGCAVIIPALMSGQPLVPTTMLRLQLPFALATFTLVWLYDLVKAAATGFRLVPTFAHCGGLWMCADQLYTLVQFYFLRSQAGRSLVTGSAQYSWNNSKVTRRASQLKRDLWDSGVGFNVLFVLGALTGMIYSAMDSINKTSDWQAHIMTTLLYPSIVMMCYINLSYHLAPIRCVIWPPRYPPSEAALEPHPSDARAVFPSEEVRAYKVRQRHAPLGYRGHLLFIPAYAIFTTVLYFLYL